MQYTIMSFQNKRQRRMRILLSFIILSFSPISHALGPLDGEATIDWWSNELSGNPFKGTLDAGTISFRAEGWWDQRWGIKGGIDLTDIDADADELEDPERYHIDLKRRLFSPTDNTFFAAGVGWENLGLESGETSNGIRLSLEGRFGFAGFATFYGESIWMPRLSSVNGLEGLSGVEFETGVVFDPLPFWSIRAGYRRFELDFDLDSGKGESTSQGIVLGTGLHW